MKDKEELIKQYEKLKNLEKLRKDEILKLRREIREKQDIIKKIQKKENIKVFLPSKALCTDNAAMIAAAGYYRYHAAPETFKVPGSQCLSIPISPNLKLTSWSNQ